MSAPISAPWMVIARSLEGEAEISGSVDNPRILEMFKVAGHPEIKDDETAWCAAFVGACLRLSGFQPTFSLLASSYAKFGDDLGQSPRTGAIVVLNPGVAGIGGAGRVGFFVREEGGNIVMLGGNQSNKVKESRFPKAALRSFRWPVVTSALPDSTLPNILVLEPDAAPDHLHTAGPGMSPKTEDVVPVGLGQFDTTNGGEVLKDGSAGASVRTLQAALDKLNYHLGEIDGEFGPLTRAAVLAFQGDNKLPLTGEADAATRAALAVGKPRPLPEARTNASVE